MRPALPVAVVPQSSRSACVGVAALFVLAPGTAYAAEGGALSEVLWHAFNLSLLLGVIVYFARTPLREAMASRRTQIASELDEARSSLERAERQLEEWQQRMGDLDHELDQIRAAVRSQAEGERDRILSDAEAGAERIRANAVAAVEQEARRARDVLRTESAELALERAGELIQRRIGDGDRDRLFDEFLSRLGELPERDDANGASPRS